MLSLWFSCGHRCVVRCAVLVEEVQSIYVQTTIDIESERIFQCLIFVMMSRMKLKNLCCSKD